MAVQRDYNKPLQEEEPYLVQNKRSTDITSLNRLQTTTDWYGNPITDPDRSNPTRNRFESPLQTIMSFQYAIAKEENELMATRPGTSTTNRRYSYQPQPSRRTSSYSAYNAQPPRQGDSRADPRDYRDSTYRSEYRSEQYLPEGNGESSSNSSYGYESHPVSQQAQPAQPAQQEYSPPSTPTRGQQNFPQTPQQSYYPPSNQQYGLPSPEPDVDYYPRAPVKPPVHSFPARPATPPSDTGEKAKKGKLGKFKRLSGLGKSKS